MDNVELCIDQNGDFVTASLAEVPGILSHPDAFAWIDVHAEDHETLNRLPGLLGVPELAIESVRDEQTRARIVLYDDLIYLEFFGLRRVGEDLSAERLGMLAGLQFLVTIRSHRQPDLEAVRMRWSTMRQTHVGILGDTEATANAAVNAPLSVKLLYSILDEIVDGYFVQVDWLGNLIEDLEDRVVQEADQNPQIEIQALRTRLLRARRLLSPEQEVLNTLLRRDVPIIPESIIPYFADVHDHLLRIHDWMETYRDQLSSIVDLQLSLQSNRLDRTMRTLTASSIILMVCSLIAGIYGMNFEHMPDLAWRWGYPISLLLMATISLALIHVFKRREWW